MRSLRLLAGCSAVLGLFSGAGIWLRAGAAATQSKASGPVLLELYTSEGCSSCPPADRLLAQWSRAGQVRGVPVVALSYHVDYWNGLGWTDRWSSPQFTTRQTEYNRRLANPNNFTPQITLDARMDAVANDERAVERLVTEAAAAPKIPLVWHDATTTSATGGPTHEAAKTGVDIGPVPPEMAGFASTVEVYAALVIPRAESSVARGENAGRTLEHVWIVKSLRKIGTVALSDKAAVRQAIPTDATDNGDPATYVIFLQSPQDGRVLGTSWPRKA